VQGASWATVAATDGPRWWQRGKRGLFVQGEEDAATALNVLADRIGEAAAGEARALVFAAARSLGESDAMGVLEVVERAAQQAVATIGLAAVSAVVDHGAARTPSSALCPACGGRARLVGRRAKQIRTLLGQMMLTRGYYYCRVCKVGFAPFDEHLGVAGTSLSPGLRRAGALAGAEMAYARGYDLVKTVTGLDLASISTLSRATRAEGARARALIDAGHGAMFTTDAYQPTVPPPTTWDGRAIPDKCYILLDGTGAPMLPSETVGRAGKPGQARDGRARTREVKIGAFFTQSTTDPVTGHPVQDPGSATYISTFKPADAFGVQVKAEYLRRGFNHIRQPIVLGDGAHWIWGIASDQLPGATQIVDYFHAREHLAALVKLLTPTINNPTEFEAHLVDLLDLGDTDAIATAINNLNLDQAAPDLLKAAMIEVGYFTSNHHRMQYADFTAAGYYIGSGPVEAACNTIVKQRAKRAGMHWTTRGLDPILAIRTLHQSGRDHELWPTPTPSTPAPHS
jgi:hypothetical protein